MSGTGLRSLALIVLTFAMSIGAVPVPAQESPAIAIETDAARDSAIAERLRAVAEGLGGYQDTSITVDGGVVMLSGKVAEPAQAEQIAEIAARIEGVAAVRNDLGGPSEIAEQIDPAFDRVSGRLAQGLALLPLAAVALVVAAVIVFLGLFFAARRQPWDRLAPNAFIAGIYRQIVRLTFAMAAIVIALDILGATALLGTILGAAGIIGLAVGFAVRDTVENFIASVMLSIRQPFRPNDLVEIEGDLGRVIRLTSRATILLSIDGNHVRIPNAVVFKSRIVNFTRNDARRFEFDIGVDPAADLAATLALVQKTVSALPFVLPEPGPVVWLENINESGAILRVGAWIDQTESDFFVARGEALRHAKDAVEESGVEVPDTTYRIRLEGAGAPLAGSLTRDTDDTAKPSPRPAGSQAPPPVAPDGDRALERIVDAERRTTSERDLLDPAAPEE